MAHDDDVQNLSSTIAALTLTSLSIDALSEIKQSVERNALFPEGHLLRGRIRIPPELFVDSWILINTTDHDKANLLSELVLTLHYSNGEQDTFTLPLFDDFSDFRNIWQLQISKRTRKEWLNSKSRNNNVQTKTP